MPCGTPHKGCPDAGNMLSGSELTWLEIKIFVREPLGVIGTSCVPVLVFVVMGRLVGGRHQHRVRQVPGRSCRRGPPRACGAADRAERRAVARHHHLDLPRGRHPQAASRHAAAAAHDPDRARAREAAVHRADAGADGAGRPALLPRRPCTCPSARFTLALLLSTASASVARLPHRERRADGAIRPADRRRSSSTR